MGVLAKTLVFLIKLYRFLISPFFSSSCKFMPTCSDYTREAIMQYGAYRGTTLGIHRLLKCHPFHKGGFDPVPPQA